MKTKLEKTLLEKAKEIEVKDTRKGLITSATDEQIELAIGWAKDEIRLGQFTQLLWGKGTKNSIGGKALYTIACWLKAGIIKGRIKV